MSVKLVSYRQGDQLCLSLCEKPRRQPYVTYVAYVLMSPAVSGTRANSPFFLTRARLLKKTDAGRVAPISACVWLWRLALASVRMFTLKGARKKVELGAFTILQQLTHQTSCILH